VWAYRRVGPDTPTDLRVTDDVLAGELAHGRVATQERFEASWRPGKTGATPPSHRMSPASLDTNAIASSATPYSKRGSVLAVKDGRRGRSTASVIS
jgi:hypothetical protein